MKKHSSKAAALLAATVSLASAGASAADFVSVNQCIPAIDYNGPVSLVSLCDASAINKKYKLKLDENGCAAKGQSIRADGLDHEVYTQVGFEEFQEKGKIKKLRACEEDEAIAVMVEL